MTTTESDTKVESQPKNDEILATSEGDAKQEPGEAKQESPKKTGTLKPAITVHKKDFEKDVVYLYQFVRSTTIPSVSACSLAIETWLRMYGIQYENIDHKFRLKSKKGQLPFVELNGKEIEDTEVIIRELSKYFDKDLDFGLTTEQKNVSHAFESMLNNHTGWIYRWWRYNHASEFIDSAQVDMKRTFNSRIPNPILNFIFRFGFKKHLGDSLGCGIGKFTDEEVFEIAKADLTTLSSFLGDKDYFFGKDPHYLDVVAFSHLAQFVYVPFGGLKEWMDSDTPNLVAFVERFKNKYWSDWEEICSTLELNTHLPKKELSAEALEAQKQEAEKKKTRKGRSGQEEG